MCLLLLRRIRRGTETCTKVSEGLPILPSKPLFLPTLIYSCRKAHDCGTRDNLCCPWVVMLRNSGCCREAASARWLTHRQSVVFFTILEATNIRSSFQNSYDWLLLRIFFLANRLHLPTLSLHSGIRLSSSLSLSLLFLHFLHLPLLFSLSCSLYYFLYGFSSGHLDPDFINLCDLTDPIAKATLNTRTFEGSTVRPIAFIVVTVISILLLEFS